jgi:DNA polymerase III alpha subunit
MAPVVEKFQPFVSVADFHERVKSESINDETGKKSFRRPNKKVVQSLIESGAFDSFGTRNEVMTEYYRLRDGKKEEVPQHSDEEWIELEKEAVGMCLSLPPLYKKYTEEIDKNKWKLVSQLGDGKKVFLFGRIESVTPKTSKTGNPMYIVKVTDGLDSFSFFVFRGAQEFFRDHFKVGTIAAIPLDKFEDGDARFYDERKEAIILSK